ncbi:P-loop containing nucleoside triphosphate hydrolase protein [Cytidiella melzeri]|nr:P-loop containing nucleoside triphosphate hydrolase protein [Cytidiella melzeri]
MSLILRRSARGKLGLPLELLSYSFHTTCVPFAYTARGGREGRGSSRTRLVKDLAPRGEKSRGRASQLEVAPRATYQRDRAPHLGLKPREQRKAPYTRHKEERGSRKSFDRDERPRPSSRLGQKQEYSPASSRRGKPPTRAGPRGAPVVSDSRAPRKFDESERRKQDDKKREYSPVRARNRPSTPAASQRSSVGSDVTKAPQIRNPLADEFDITTRLEPTHDLPLEFTSSPLMDGLRNSIIDVLGPRAKPTPIQSLSLKHLFAPPPESGWREYLLASETGSGKSFAYMLPMLQDLKTSELDPSVLTPSSTGPLRSINPRAIVLAPTHELSRQLSRMAKSLSHNIKLRVLCASQANKSLRSLKPATASKLSTLGEDSLEAATSQFTQKPVDVLVGTTSKILEMVRGHGWNWDNVIKESKEASAAGTNKHKTFIIGEPEVGLERVEWVIVDEADVLFDPDFRNATRMLLADVAAARGHTFSRDSATTSYPFNLLLTSATIPSSLATYLDTHHPNLKRLASPNLHKLPATVKTEHASWTSGNRAADVEAHIRRTWFGDTAHGSGVRSKVLVFCNKSAKVEELGKYLASKGVPNVALTSTADARKRGNNHHINSFLRTPLPRNSSEDLAKPEKSEDEPHVLITTSLLSRGLDFSPEIQNVLIVDPPRNMIDFLHRAGRTGRAGARGTVVIFGKTKGRGVTKYKEVRRRVNALA